MKQSELIVGETYAVEISYRTYRPAIFEGIEREENSLGRVVSRKLRFKSVELSEERGQELRLGRVWAGAGARTRGHVQGAGETIHVKSGKKVIDRWEPFVERRLEIRAKEDAEKAERQRQTELGAKLAERLTALGVHVSTDWYERSQHVVTISEGDVSITVDGLAALLDAAGVK